MNRNYLKSLPRYFSIKKTYKINNVLKLKYVIQEIDAKLEYLEIKKIFNEDKLEKTYYFINKRFRPKIYEHKMPNSHFYNKNFFKRGNQINDYNCLEQKILKFAKKNDYLIFDKEFIKTLYKKLQDKIDEILNKTINEELIVDIFRKYQLFVELKNVFISSYSQIELYISFNQCMNEKFTERDFKLRFKYDISAEHEYTDYSKFFDLNFSNFIPDTIKNDKKERDIFIKLILDIFSNYDIYFQDSDSIRFLISGYKK